MRERGLAPPPKHAIHLGGQKEMLDRRREELERWLWRLIAKPELARSQALRSFLEFDRALARFQQQQQQQQQPNRWVVSGECCMRQSCSVQC